MSTPGPMLRPMLRTMIGFIISPLAPGLLLTAVVACATEHAGAAWSVLFVSAALAYPAAIVVGVPMYVLFRRWGWSGWRTYIVAGPLLGIAALAGWSVSKRMGDWLGLSRETVFVAPLFVAAVMICGMVAALCFWLIVRPDRIVKHAEPATSS